MKVLAAIVSVWALTTVFAGAPAPVKAASLALDGTTPGDDALMFRRYRGDDEVGDRDNSGRGRGRGRGGSDGADGGGGGDHGKGSGEGKKHGGSGASGSQGGRSNARDDADRFGR